MSLSDDGATCEISVEPVVELAGDEVNAGVLRMTDARIFLEDMSRIAVFDREGRFLRYLGREGQGPGEFSVIQDVVPLGLDRLAVFESGPPRLTVLDTTGAALHTAQLPVIIGRGGALLLPDSTFLLSGRMFSRTHFGSPVVHVSATGELIRYLGENEVERDGFAKDMVMPRLIAHDPRLGVIALKSHKYVIESWSITEGTITASVARQPDWFGDQPEPVRGEDPHLVVRPRTMFRGVGIDRDARVWVVAAVPGAEWERGVERGVVVDRDAWIDTRIEVLDIERNAVLCSAVFPLPTLTGFAQTGHIASYEEGRGGNPRITIWRLSFVRERG